MWLIVGFAMVCDHRHMITSLRCKHQDILYTKIKDQKATCLRHAGRNDTLHNMVRYGKHDIFDECGNIQYQMSTDWLKGKFTGRPHMSWENQWFPVDFPINQSIENDAHFILQNTGIMTLGSRRPDKFRRCPFTLGGFDGDDVTAVAITCPTIRHQRYPVMIDLPNRCFFILPPHKTD